MSPRRKLKDASLRRSFGGLDDDSRSMGSIQLEQLRRHSIAGAPARDDESLGSNQTVLSYMVPTESAPLKTWSPLTLGIIGFSEKNMPLPKLHLSYHMEQLTHATNDQIPLQNCVYVKKLKLLKTMHHHIHKILLGIPHKIHVIPWSSTFTSRLIIFFY